MEIQRKFFPSIQAENEITYFAHLEGVIGSVDELCSLMITRTTQAYSFRIAPSHPKYNNMLIEELLKFHNMFKIRLDMSKSIKTSGTIVFRITLPN
jgi:hypothetical protein